MPNRIQMKHPTHGLKMGAVAFLAITVAMLAGCAGTPPPRPSMVIKQPPVPPSVQAHPLNIPRLQEKTLPQSNGNSTSNTPPQAVQTASTPAVLALVSRAETQTQSGDFGGAEATLERAVQIQPHNTRLWLDFAQLRLAQKQPAQAEQFALRAVQYAQNNREVSAAWQMVAKTRQAQGDTKGAAEARRKAGFVPGQTQG
ncbi:tetratricopeptide repeat protein [Halothiobacillus neapolitanus]|uniref:Tetratricopeptide repeat protein n=1 Tax=Halothiobacillus neapolitanus (strain ATCC 23641 / DSM 15147 / CIP 104769 / NCIMB 8539 / c2) TaxID=555778 RepID=D0KYH9_HALNC|nr:tetratricopeptide repeat protein [Halothiobacillus neapolitanus]ACX95502.1 Tetratricopeptide repeat protein [Halothiobacillus neapolitanus c2]TDN65799.1 tetratricopeptide repeat protein [Halothiobacillus neapolitanus]